MSSLNKNKQQFIASVLNLLSCVILANMSGERYSFETSASFFYTAGIFSYFLITKLNIFKKIKCNSVVYII